MKKNSLAPQAITSAAKRRLPINHTRTLGVLIVLAFIAVAMFTSWAVVSGQGESRIPGGSQRGGRLIPPTKGLPDDVPNVGNLRPTTVQVAPISLSRRILRLFAPTASTLYVNPDGVCGGNSPCFTTIQAAINAASPGDTINVAAATYAEQIDVNKALTLLGPNANINPNTGARVAEAIIIPTASDPLNPSFAGPLIVTLSVSGVTFNGFTVDGNNPSLTSGVVFNGVDVDAEFGIYGPETTNPDVVLSNNIVKNIGELAVWITSNGQVGAKNANSRITTNKVDNVLGVFGQGLRIGEDAWVDVTNNVVTRARNGIVIENYPGNTDPHPASVISV